MANHRRKHPHWSKLCVCKFYKQAGNSTNRLPHRDAKQTQSHIAAIKETFR